MHKKVMQAAERFMNARDWVEDFNIPVSHALRMAGELARQPGDHSEIITACDTTISCEITVFSSGYVEDSSVRVLVVPAFSILRITNRTKLYGSILNKHNKGLSDPFEFEAFITVPRALVELEAKVFAGEAAAPHDETIPVRISRLETRVLGETVGPQLSIMTRILGLIDLTGVHVFIGPYEREFEME